MAGPTTAADEVDAFLELNNKAPEQQDPTAWEGTGQALKGAMAPSASAGRTLMMIGGLQPMFTDKVASLVSGEDVTSGQDAYFKGVDEVGNSAVEYWRPDTTTMGSAARGVNTLSTVVGSVPQLIGTPELFLANAMFDPATDLVNDGVDADTAINVGAANLAVNALGLKIPAAFGKTLPTRVATGAGANLGMGIAVDAASANALEEGGYTEQAERYDWTDGNKRWLDALMGGAFGFTAHVDAPTTSRYSRDAVLTARNAQHFTEGTMPGEPATRAAAVQHQSALATAIKQSLAGDRVDIASQIKAEDFVIRPELRPTQPVAGGAVGFEANFDSVLKSEGGYVNDPVDRGGETNFGISQKNNPDIDVANLTREGAAKIYRERYWNLIEADKLPATIQGTAFDAAVNQGVAWTRKALAEAGGDAGKFNAMREARYRSIVARDPSQAKFLRGWLNRLGKFKETNPAGEALRTRLVENPDQLAVDYAALKDSEGGVILNTDVARELSPEYLADRTRSADVHEAASDFVKTIYERKLAEPTPAGKDRVVLFTAGGTGAGKTTALSARGTKSQPEIIYDTNMNTLSSAVDKVEQALTAGRKVDIAYVYRDPVEALTAGALPRAERQAREFGSGRTVPLSEHAKTHTGVRPVMEALAEKYRDNPDVRITAIDNSRGKGKQAVVTLEEIPRVEENLIHERLSQALESARAAGLDESIYRGFQSPGRQAQPALGRDLRSDGSSPSAAAQAGQVTAETPLDAAVKLAAENPSTQFMDFDSDGNPRYRPMSEVVAEIEAERLQAARDAEGIVAAVNCHIRRGDA